MARPPPPRTPSGGRFRDWLAWEQWTILLVAATVLTAGIDWGLPTQRRIDLLLAGTTLTTEQRQSLTSVHDSRRESFLEKRAAATKALLSGGEFRSATPVTQATAVLTEQDKLAGLCSFIINSGDYDEALTYSSLSRMRPSRLDFAPRYFMYGGAYLYPVGALLQLLKMSGALRVTNDYAYYIDRPREMALIYTTGRALNVAAFIGTLVVLARIGRRLGGRGVGSLAMLVYALSTLPLNQSLVSKPHVYAAFWSTLSILLALRYREKPSRRLVLITGVAWGMAVGSSLPCLLMGIVIGSVLFDGGDANRSAAWFLGAAAAMGVTFIATNPYAVLQWDRYAYEVLGHTSARGWGYGAAGLGKLAVSLDRLLTRGYCFPVSLVGAITLVGVSIAGGRAARRLAIATSITLLISHMLVAASRITLFTGPMFCLFGAYGLHALNTKLARTPRWVRAAVLGLLLLPGAAFATIFAVDVIWDEPWYEPTRSWIEAARLDTGPLIGICGAPWDLQLHPADSPPYPFLNARVVNLARYEDPSALPDYVIVGVSGEGRERWGEHPLRPHYALARVLGYRPHDGWAVRWRTPAPAVAAWVYEPRGTGMPR